MMILYIGWNDLMKTDPANESRLDEYRWLATLLDGSYLIKAYKKLLFVNLRPLLLRPTTIERLEDATAFDDFVPTHYRSNLEEMIGELQQHGTRVMLVTLPTVMQPGMTDEDLQRANVFFPYFAGAYGVSRLLSLHRAYNRTIVEVGERHHVEVVDLARMFEGVRDRTTYFWDTMHPSERGHALIAEALSSRIKTLEAEGRL
jgi:lysophospholipase L1-like esterase